MNADNAVDVVNDFLDQLRESFERWNRGDTAGRQVVDDVIRRRLPLLERIGAELDPEHAAMLQTETRGWPWQWVREAALRLQGILADDRLATAVFGPTGPQLAATGLHPWVWNAAATLWDGGHYRAAVHAAATLVDENLQAKLGRFDASGAQLVTDAFATKTEATPQSPRLRFRGVDRASDDWTSRHEGAMHFGRGCMMAIRNPATHHTVELDPQLALEQLAALSVLARWIEEAEAVTAE